MSAKTPTATLAATFTSAVLSATNTPLVPTATSTFTNTVLSPFSSLFASLDGTISRDNISSNQILCDWIRSASDCRDADFIRYLLIVSSAMHGIVFLFGFWLLTYRNRGLNGKIVTELFTKVGSGIRPKPMDCIVFFTGIASLVKVGVNIPLILDIWKHMLWLRIAIEQIYWIIVAIGFSSYFVGLLYAMPVTTRQGGFAVYQPETTFNSQPLQPIHVLTPTTAQKNFVLLMGAVYPTVFAAGVGVASAALAQMPGYEELSNTLLIVQYLNWVLILWTMAVMFFYYGLKYTFILRANIIIAEAALKAPRAAFGISNLRSSSPARFLFVQLQITGFGGSAVTLLAGSLCMIWALCRRKILAMSEDQLPHTMAFFWTCAIAVAYFVIMALIAVQSVRSRRRGLHEQVSSMTNSSSPGSGQKTTSAVAKSPYSSHNHKVRAESEVRLALKTSSDFGTLRSEDSMEKGGYGTSSPLELSDGHYRHDPITAAALVEASRRFSEDTSNEYQTNRQESELGNMAIIDSPARPFRIKAQNTGMSDNSDATFGRRGSDSTFTVGNSRQYLRSKPDPRHNVYGGRPARPFSPPVPSSSTSSSSSSPSFPLIAMRSSSRVSSGSNNKYGSSDEHYLSAASDRQHSQTVSQLSHSSSSLTTCSESQTLSTSSLKDDKHSGFTTVPDGYAMSAPERSYRSAERDNRSASRRQPSAQQPLSQPARQQQPKTYEEQPFRSLKYHVSGSSLSPPPRAKRLANTPRSAESPVVLPSSPLVTHSPARIRNTFISTDVYQEGSPSPVYSDMPRHGGGVRRKSIKDEDEVLAKEPNWPLPPSLTL
ncbi:hypothetical protein BGZ98_004635 [Dissophora globulifera]|nr:hypothetical protein BGZ98_004635 [Dissophora globulifera]